MLYANRYARHTRDLLPLNVTHESHDGTLTAAESRERAEGRKTSRPGFSLLKKAAYLKQGAEMHLYTTLHTTRVPGRGQLSTASPLAAASFSSRRFCTHQAHGEGRG